MQTVVKHKKLEKGAFFVLERLRGINYELSLLVFKSFQKFHFGENVSIFEQKVAKSIRKFTLERKQDRGRVP